MAFTSGRHVRSTNIETEIQRMVDYIEQDGLEKVEEIDLKAEEEFIIEKNKARDVAVQQIDTYYDKLEDKVNKSTKAEYSRTSHSDRMKYLHAESNIINEIRSAAKERLHNIRHESNRTPYKKVLTALILQGIFKLLEFNVTVKYHSKDKELIDDCISKAKSTFKDKLGKEIELKKSEEHLTDEQIGGVIILSKSGRVLVDNSLQSRFYNVAEKADCAILPQYRLMLFGTNPNRKYKN